MGKKKKLHSMTKLLSWYYKSEAENKIGRLKLVKSSHKKKALNTKLCFHIKNGAELMKQKNSFSSKATYVPPAFQHTLGSQLLAERIFSRRHSAGFYVS